MESELDAPCGVTGDVTTGLNGDVDGEWPEPPSSPGRVFVKSGPRVSAHTSHAEVTAVRAYGAAFPYAQRLSFQKEEGRVPSRPGPEYFSEDRSSDLSISTTFKRTRRLVSASPTARVRQLLTGEGTH